MVKQTGTYKDRERKIAGSKVKSSTNWVMPKHTDILKTVESLHFPARISCQSHVKLIDTITENLDEQQLNVIKNCCLGHLLEMPCRLFCGNIVHSLLLREISSSNENEEKDMKILIGRQIIRFSKQEFALVTGLSFTGTDALVYLSTNSSRLMERYFDSSKKISLTKLEETFIHCQDNNDKVKLGMVLLVEGVLLGKQKQTGINPKFLQLVEDFSKFNTYPWGKVSYSETMSYLRHALEGRATKYIARKQANPSLACDYYKLGGFPYAFQVWAFESIPMLKDECADTVNCNKCPRILHWRCKSSPTYKKIQELFGFDKLKVLSRVSPTVEEKKQHYMKCFLSTDEVDENDNQVPRWVLDEQIPHRLLVGQTLAQLPKKRKKIEEKASTFDPLRPIPPEDLNALFQYINNWTTKAGRIDVGVCDADNTFFADLVKANSWLSDIHMDAALYHMRYRSAKYPNIFGHRWTTADCLWMQKMTSQCNTLKSKKSGGGGEDVDYFVQYIHGAYLKFAKLWTTVDKVYVPVNVKSSHWIAVEIDLVSKVLKVYDSMISSCRKHATETALKCLTTLLPIVFESAAFYETRKELYDSKSRPWTIERVVDGIPQQKNGNDCGMFTLKFIECLSSGIPLSTCKQENMEFFRQKLAVDLFKASLY